MRFRCKHVNFVENTHFANESEFLFSPYSVFDVEKVKWSDNCNYMQPHEITLRCCAMLRGIWYPGVAVRLEEAAGLPWSEGSCQMLIPTSRCIHP